MHVLPILLTDDNTEIIRISKEIPFLNVYGLYLKNKLFTSSSNVVGLKMIENNRIVGMTILLLHSKDNLVVGNITNTYIFEEFRGRGLSSFLLNEAKKYCDVLTNLTPVDAIINLFKSDKVPGFKSTSNYQMWINVHKIKKDKVRLVVVDLPVDCTSIDESIRNGMFGYEILINDEPLDICFYKFKRRGLVIIEITYVNNKDLFKNFFFSVIKALSKKQKIDIALVDGVFINNSFKPRVILKNKKSAFYYFCNLFRLMFSKTIYLECRKFYWVKKKDIRWDINYLSSELCFYR